MPFAPFDSGPVLDDSSGSEDDEMDLDESHRVLRIAIDFGTTFSSVAYTLTRESNHLTRLADVACIARYPGDNPIPIVSSQWEPRQDVPTELLYPAIPIRSQMDRRSTRQNQDQSSLEHDQPDDSDASSAISVEDFDKKHTPDEHPEFLRAEKQSQFEELAWGFEVQEVLASEIALRSSDQHLARFKLLLDRPRDESDKVQDIKLKTSKKMKRLKRQKLINSDTDLVTHFFQKLFRHVKTELEQADRWNSASNVEFILSVPAVWPSKACRTMQDSLAKAVNSCAPELLKHDQLNNLFIVSEPEAAATCILAEPGNDDILPGETIVIVDAGGGTVDVVTYEITNTDPLRLSAEIVPPETEPCGATYINEKYAEFLLKKLQNETYLEKNGKTIQGIIAREVILFELTTKRILDLNNPSHDIKSIYVDDLRPSQTDSQLQENWIKINRQDIEKIFRYSLKGTAKLLQKQLTLAKEQGHSVHKVLLTGGFGQSPFLQSHLRRFLSREANFNLAGGEIPLLVPTAASTAVARGAVLRASNKALGPSRMSSCSYGFLVSEHYEPEVVPAHRYTRSRIDPIDGEAYVHHTIEWLFVKNEVLDVRAEKSRRVRHTFASTRKSLVCKEILYVSDDVKESHYRKTHPKNKDAEQAGSIVVDMTFLKDQGLIQPEPVSAHSTFHGKDKKVWVVEFDLVLTVNGRNMIYEARWPVNQQQAEQHVLSSGQLCIAATFKPGTA